MVPTLIRIMCTNASLHDTQQTLLLLHSRIRRLLLPQRPTTEKADARIVSINFKHTTHILIILFYVKLAFYCSLCLKMPPRFFEKRSRKFFHREHDIENFPPGEKCMRNKKLVGVETLSPSRWKFMSVVVMCMKCTCSDRITREIHRFWRMNFQAAFGRSFFGRALVAKGVVRK